MFTRLLSRVGACLTVIAVIVSATAVPAQAAPAITEACTALLGTYRQQSIDICLTFSWAANEDPDVPPRHFEAFTEVRIAQGVTSATDCKVTVYVRFDAPGRNPWNSPKNTRSCKNSLDLRGTPVGYFHFATETIANTAELHSCVDLYYNNSTSSGWQRCYVDGWVSFP